MDCPIVKGNHDEQASLIESSRDFNDWPNKQSPGRGNNLTADDKGMVTRPALAAAKVRDFTIVHATLDSRSNGVYFQ